MHITSALSNRCKDTDINRLRYFCRIVKESPMLQRRNLCFVISADRNTKVQTINTTPAHHIGPLYLTKMTLFSWL